MTALFRSGGGTFRRILRCLAVGLLVGSVCGCAAWKARNQASVAEEGFAENELSESVRKARPKTKTSPEYSSLSEKGRQIERDLNAM